MDSDFRPKNYWFPAKRYGIGWGLPCSWQGWVSLAIFFGLIYVSFLVFPPEEQIVGFWVSNVVLTMALLAVCWVKGEPCRWRWGRD